MKQQIINMLDSSVYLLSKKEPSEWAEENRFMTSEVSPFPGIFSFNRTPYLREILNTISPNHPAHIVAIMKGAQLGMSTGVIENAIGYIISENPGNILFLTGHTDLAEEAMSGKIDQMIDSCGLRNLIRPNVLRKKNQRTGDTNKSKEFPGGSLVSGGASNHKLLRQRSVRYGFIDDFDAAKIGTKESGSTREMIEQRFAAYHSKKKIYYISTPELEELSNIEPVYLLGDQRKYYVPCPECGAYITLEWSIDVDNNVAGITYKRDSAGNLIEGSVGYVCQECGSFFKERFKQEMLINGEWRPTAIPSEIGFYSYHLNSLYAPAGMYDWEKYVRQYVKANPLDAPVKQRELQTFTNLVLGKTYKYQGDVPQANSLQKNVREYEINVIPETLSIKDGNGSIILLTCACDLNGIVDDARLDYEILAWSESGSNYSIKHGSIGTFVPMEKDKHSERIKWTYSNNEVQNVWDEFKKIIEEIYVTDNGRKMRIMLTGVDTGHYTNFAYNFIENSPSFTVGLKGKDEDKYKKPGADTPSFRRARNRNDLYLIEVNQLKDDLAEFMTLKWKSKNEQPANFMNFPTPSGGLYTFNNYFSHFESEHRILDSDSMSFRWVKINSLVQNHMWDCRIYNMALRDIITQLVCNELKIKNYSWKDFCDTILGRR